MAVKLNRAAFRHAQQLIGEGKVVKDERGARASTSRLKSATIGITTQPVPPNGVNVVFVVDEGPQQ